MSNSTIIRVQKTQDFTIMSNYHFKDKNISLKAKGLLSQMLSLPSDWDYSIQGLAAINKEGVDAIKSTLKELEKYGYITRQRLRNKLGQLSQIEYTVYEKPMEENQRTFSEKPPKVENPLLEDEPKVENPLVDKPRVENPYMENPRVENPRQLNTKLINILNNKISINQSNEKEIDRLIDLEKYTKLIKDNIAYDEALCIDHKDNIEQINEIINIMAETVVFNDKPVKINGNYIPADIVKTKFLQINDMDIEYILKALSKNTTKIHNIKAYLIATIFNAKNTVNNYYNAEVMHDMYGNQGD